MRPRLFTVAAAASLVLLLAGTWLWLRSYASEVVLVESRPGRLVLIGLDAPAGPARAARDAQTTEAFLADLLTPNVVNQPVEHRLLGFWYARGDGGRVAWPAHEAKGYDHYYCAFWVVAVPYWAVVPPAAVLPAAWAWRRRRAARRRWANACARCGYDLRATPGRCPECGSVPTVGAA